MRGVPILSQSPMLCDYVTVLVAVVFLTTTFVSDCLLCQMLPYPRCV